MAPSPRTVSQVRAALERIEASGAPPSSSKVMIVGAGYAGVEMASVVAERMAGKAQVQEGRGGGRRES